MLADFARCWFLTGPTASGKSAVGLALARVLGAEVVALDSMSVYRRMDIGTAKPSIQERNEVPHHLLDVVEPGEEYSVARYLADAKSAVREIESRGRLPLFVGGTPLYLKALLRGMDSGPEADWTIRQRLLEEAQARGPLALFARLQAVDPESAARLHANDVRRVIRALEVYEQTGQPISRLQTHFSQEPEVPRPVFVLTWPRTTLNKRIDTRVDAMFATGLVEEVRQIWASGPLSRTAAQAVGYAEVIDLLAGRRELAETIALVKTRTRQFAKRQLTWFRRLGECRAVGLSEPWDPVGVAQFVVEQAIAAGFVDS